MSFKILLSASLTLISICSFAQRNINQKPIPSPIKVQRLENGINTAASDFAPARYGDRIYFTSMYKNITAGNMVARIYSFTEGTKAQVVKDMDMKQKAAHISHIAFMPDASRMYFTICRDDNQTKCEIWYRDKAFEGNWGVAKKLPDYINQRNSTSTQPSIGWDEEQKKFALFFVSDRMGGRGGLDIWVSHISSGGQFDTPYPLPINTDKDDVTPYFDRNAQILYFSSNGIPGEGGFDIFKSDKKGDFWDRPTNMGRPYNSGYDDLYYMSHEVSGKAYFTSDRPGSICSGSHVNGWNCYDIYEVIPNEQFDMFSSKGLRGNNSTVMHEVDND